MGKRMNALMMAGAVVAGGALAGCATPERTFGPGSGVTAQGDCDQITTTKQFDDNGDYYDYAVSDVSVDADILRGAGEEGAHDATNDQLHVHAAGVGRKVTEIVFSGSEGQDLMVESVSGLPWDQTVDGDNEIRVDVDDLRAADAEHDTLTIEVREDVRKATISIKALANPEDGAAVTFDQDCGVYAKVTG